MIKKGACVDGGEVMNSKRYFESGHFRNFGLRYRLKNLDLKIFAELQIQNLFWKNQVGDGVLCRKSVLLVVHFNVFEDFKGKIELYNNSFG